MTKKKVTNPVQDIEVPTWDCKISLRSPGEKPYSRTIQVLGIDAYDALHAAAHKLAEIFSYQLTRHRSDCLVWIHQSCSCKAGNGAQQRDMKSTNTKEGK